MAKGNWLRPVSGLSIPWIVCVQKMPEIMTL